MKWRFLSALMALFVLCTAFAGCSFSVQTDEPASSVSIDELPAYDGEAYVVLGDNVPLFTEGELTTASYELYGALDALGRCGTAMACVGQDIMPTEERGSIGSIKPTGWQTAKYDFVDGKYLYNRCHLIGFQLTGENANEHNLITGTRYMNVEGMLPFENMVADYVKETGNHVMYRVTPLFEGNNLLAHGVTMEAYSVEDNGEGICFYVYCYNVQPGVKINYRDGTNLLDKGTDTDVDAEDITFVLNTASKKVHFLYCDSVETIADDHFAYTSKSLAKLIAEGYEPCGKCLV